jgi:4'-phosphopantetheinyl transferase
MISKGEIHVWRGRLDTVDAAKLRRQLSCDEQERADRFAYEHDRSRFIASHALLRQIVARYAMTRPADLRFRHTPHGKPEIEGTIRFNLSRSVELALVAVSVDREVGVDVEFIRTDLDFEGITGRFFSRRERDELGYGRGPLDVRRFFECWTRKEAVVKALGLGLSLSLDSFSVSLGDGSVTPERGWPEGRSFSVRGVDVGGNYAAAIAFEELVE